MRLLPAALLTALLYFGYHTVNGDYGLLAMKRLERQQARLADELAALQATKSSLERRIKLLHPDHVDRDLLEEEAVRQLGFSKPGDIIILQKLP